MGHGPAVKLGVDKATGYKSRIGISMFLLYLACYVIFVAINAVSPKTHGDQYPRAKPGSGLRIRTDCLRPRPGCYLQPSLHRSRDAAE